MNSSIKWHPFLSKNPLLFLILGALFASSTARAEERSMENASGYIGGMVGGNLPNGESRSSTSPLFGIVAGFKASPSLGLGFFGTYFGQSNPGSVFGLPAGTETRTMNLCGEGSFFVSIFHFGVDVGTSINSWSAVAGNATVGTSKSEFVYGPQAGLALPLGRSGLSAGASAHYLLNNSDDNQNNLLLLADLTVWL